MTKHQDFCELVVAHFNEDLRWLNNVPPNLRVTVYSKNLDGAPATFPNAQLLPNIGRESHTYLHHIVTRYDTLSPLTVFCQGKPFDHAFDFRRTLREWSQNPELVRDFSWLGHIIDTDDARGQRLFVPWSKNPKRSELDLHGFHRALFNIAGPEKYTFRLGAQFGITRALIRNRSRDFYMRALEIARDFPEAAHCFERSWDKVFDVLGIDSTWLGGRETVYLKPIRRLEN